MAKADIKIGTRSVGPGSPVYFIAEAGSNHDRSFDQARRLIDVAAEAGADAVKFQAFKAESLYPKRAGQSAYLKDARSIYDIIRDLEMPLDWIPPLAELCAARGLHFLCTPFDFQSADALDAHVPAFKIASYDMTNDPLLQHVARKGKPLIVSTGTADLDEVRAMIAAVRAAGNPGLVVLQCTAKYPAPLDALNIRDGRQHGGARGLDRALRSLARAAARPAGGGGAGRGGHREALHLVERPAGTGPCLRARAARAQGPHRQDPAGRGGARLGRQGRSPGGAGAARLRAPHDLHHARHRRGGAASPARPVDPPLRHHRPCGHLASKQHFRELEL